MKRIYAWYEQAIIDRPPVRFTRHNAEFEDADNIWKPEWRELKDKWFDEEYQLEKFMTQVRGKRYQGETFPVFWPNLGPVVSAAFYDCPIEFGDVTSWSLPLLKDYDQPLTFDWNNPYLKKLESLTRIGLEHCKGKFLVGYSDLHGGMDVLAALRGTEPLLWDLVDNPDAFTPVLDQITADFLRVYDYFDDMLKAAGQPSVTWMGVPSFGKMHIPSCDFAFMISSKQFVRYQLDLNRREMAHMDSQRLPCGRQRGGAPHRSDPGAAQAARHPVGAGDGRRHPDHAVGPADQAHPGRGQVGDGGSDARGAGRLHRRGAARGHPADHGIGGRGGRAHDSQTRGAVVNK